jgi:hypothetical protein
MSEVSTKGGNLPQMEIKALRAGRLSNFEGLNRCAQSYLYNRYKPTIRYSMFISFMAVLADV